MRNYKLSPLQREIAKSLSGYRFLQASWGSVSHSWDHDHCYICSDKLCLAADDDCYDCGYIILTVLDENCKASKATLTVEKELRLGGWKSVRWPWLWLCPRCFEELSAEMPLYTVEGEVPKECFVKQ
jgi:hypothetical protein